MKRLNRMDVLRLILVLSLIAGAGLALGAVGRFTPTHRIVEPVYCGSCHTEQVQELSATTHLAHFAQASYEVALEQSGKTEAQAIGSAMRSNFYTAEAVSGGCMMCHNTWLNREKIYVNAVNMTNSTIDGTVNTRLTYNDVVFSRTNESVRYGVAVDTYGDQYINLVTGIPTPDSSPSDWQGLNQTTVVVRVNGPGQSGLIALTALAKTTDYTTNATGTFLVAGSVNISRLEGTGTVDVEYQEVRYEEHDVTASGSDQTITVSYTPLNTGSVIVTVFDPGTSGMKKGAKLALTTDYTVVGDTVTLIDTAVNVTRLADSQGSVLIQYEDTNLETNPGVPVDIDNANQDVELSVQGIDTASVVVSVLNGGTSGVTGTLEPTVDYTVNANGIVLLASSPLVDALNQGDGTIRVAYNVTSTKTQTLKELWGSLSALSPRDGAFVSDKDPAESCGNLEKGFCHAVEVAMGKNLLNTMPENKLGVRGSGIFYQHEMAYTSGEYAAKQVKFCGVCHFNKLPPMTADGEPDIAMIKGPKVTRTSGGHTFTSEPNMTSKDWAHKMVQCIRCHGHAGIGTSASTGGVISN